MIISNKRFRALVEAEVQEALEKRERENYLNERFRYVNDQIVKLEKQLNIKKIRKEPTNG